MVRILLVEDDPSFGYILSEYLLLQGFEVLWAKSGGEALERLSRHQFNLAILDIMLPDTLGFDLAQAIRKNSPALPFIFLSARSLKIDKLKGYKVGAMDYITKPVDEELLLAKINALIGKNNLSTPTTTQYQIGHYAFNVPLQQLAMDDRTTKLTSRETALLELLCQHENQLLPRKKALQEIWGSVDEFSRKSMDVFISHLRKYLSGDESVSIVNIHGNGFVLKTENRR